MGSDPPARGAGPEGPLGVPGGGRTAPAGPARYRAVLDSLSEVVFQTDAVGNWTYLNRAWEEITGHPIAETLGRNFLEWVHPDEREDTIRLFASVVQQGLSHCHHETRYRTADGSYRWIELRSSVLLDDEGNVAANAGTILDITARRRYQELLAEHARILELVASGVPLADTLGAVAGLLAAEAGAAVSVSSRPSLVRPGPGGEPVGLAVYAGADGSVEALPAEFAMGGPAPPDVHSLEVAVRSPATGTRLGTITLHHREGGEELDEETRSLLGRCVHLAAIAMERQLSHDAAHHRALHDELTGLPNRTLLADRLQQALDSARRERRLVGLLALDLDHFKVINDTLGHEAGDRVLRNVAGRLTGRLRASDTVCRMGGDEFAIVLPSLASLADAERIASNLRRALRAPFGVEGIDLHVEASVGIAVSERGDDQPRDLFRRADIAMYRAKRERAGQASYDPDLDAERLRGMGLAAELRNAIETGHLVVHYQPKVALPSRDIVGVEGLVRWVHPERGLVPPGDFVPLAETTGSIKPLSLWVLRRALADSRAWAAAGLDLPVAVNLSAGVLHDAEFPALVAGLLREEPSIRLEFEVTESAVMANPETALGAMSRLSRAGAAFALDDFGTGYSSLAYLKRLPAQVVKIDKSFVRDMATDERDASIVRAAIELAHSLGLSVVAEGVETAEVAHLLVDLGCDEAQGFFFARPMPQAELVDVLTAGGQPRQLSAQNASRADESSPR